jgi:hypothetical protein
MNPDTFNKALDACVEYRKQIDEKTNEVARLKEENANLRGTLKSFVLVSPIEAERMEKMEQEYERLKKLMRNYIDFIDANMGTTADWPMEAAFDDETTAQRHCDLLNAMKREVKPEDIN